MSADPWQDQIDRAASRSLWELRKNKTDLGHCDYYRGVGICSATGGLCAVIGEPLCTTEVPSEGWPSEQVER